MSTQLSAQDLHFLGVIAWPEGSSRSELALYVADATGIDADTLRLLIARPPPAILGSISRDRAASGAKAIQRVGGDAFVCSLAQIESLGPTLKARDVQLVNGMLEVELWRLEPQKLALSDITLLVRGSLDKQEKRVQAPPRPLTQHSPLGRSLRSYQESRVTFETITGASEKLDVHTRDGRVFQIDGDKFGYSILGEGRGHSDRQNMGKMLSLLAHFVPDAIVDDFFRLWSPPPEIKRFQLPLMKINNEDPAFAFYSRWVAHMYRHLGAFT